MTNNDCYQELYKRYETERLILERTNENDYLPLAKMIIKKNVNLYFQRPIVYLENLDKAVEYIKSQTINSVSFTIKIKNNGNPIPIGQVAFFYMDNTCKEIAIFYYIGEDFQKKGYAGEACIPLIRHLFESLPFTRFIHIDYEVSNLGSQKISEKIINDILKYHPKYHYGKLKPFVDKYTMVGEPKDGKVTYFFEGYDRQVQVTYPDNYFDNKKYFEVKSKGDFLMKED